MFEVLFGMPLAARLLIACLIVLLAFLLLKTIIIVLHSKSERMAKPTYAGLLFVATILRVVGAIVATFYLWATIFVAITGTIGNTSVDVIGRLLVTERLIGGLAGGILAFAFGELLRALMDISLNTRSLIEINKSIVQLLEGRSTLSAAPDFHQNGSDATPRDAHILEGLERVLIGNGKLGKPLVQTNADTVAKDEDGSKQSIDAERKQRAQSFAEALASNRGQWVAPN